MRSTDSLDSDRVGTAAHTRRRLLAGTAGLGLSLLAGCAAIESPLKAPAFSFVDLELRDLARERVRLGIRVQAANPNPLAIPIASLVFAVEIAGVEIATGAAADAPFTLPARGSRELVLDLDGRTSRLLEAVRRMPPTALAGGVAWRLHGTARWGSLGLPIPFERNGRLEAARLLRRQTPGPGPAQPATP
jgi:LEA14-like dessication related protein